MKQKSTKEKILDALENKPKRFGIGYTKTIHGCMVIEAKDEVEAKEKFYEGDFVDENDNKSDYVFDEDDKGEPIFYDR